MTFFQAFLLRIIQGLTEFIPVSSTAHLLILQDILNIPASDATLHEPLTTVRFQPSCT